MIIHSFSSISFARWSGGPSPMEEGSGLSIIGHLSTESQDMIGRNDRNGW